MGSTISTYRGLIPLMGFSSLEPPHTESSPVAYGESDEDSNVNDEIEILSVSWNQNYTYFAVGTSCGFQIYNCDPLKETLRRDLRRGAFGIVEMLFRTNIFALVGGGANPHYPPNKVMLWDDCVCRCRGEFTFRSDVRAVRLREDCMVVVIKHRIYVYDLTSHKVLHRIETSTNRRGLCSLSHESSSCVLASPGLLQGQVRVEHFDLNLIRLIHSHDSSVACFTLTPDWLLLATASVKGTLIRIFNTVNGTRLQEVRRGSEIAEIYSIAFSPNVQWMVVSSAKGTIHTFSLRVREAGEDASRPASSRGAGIVCQNSTSLDALVSPNTGANFKSSLSFVKGMLPKYFSSEWSFSQFHLPEVTHYIAAFGAQNTVMIVGMDGSFYRFSFDPVNGGAMMQQEYAQFLKPESQ